MKVIDLNGDGRWSRDAILGRYASYCRSFNVKESDLTPNEVIRGEKKWIYPVMEKIIHAIEEGDRAARLIGIEFIEEDRKFPFGKILKSNTARALRRAELSGEEEERIRRRMVRMLLDANVPHEYKQYAKLLKKIGLGEYRLEIENRIERSNPYVMKYYSYLIAR